MHIGLIGGIGPAATDLYHRGLIERVGPGLDLTIAHASSATLIANQGAGQADAQAAIFATLTERLERAGAETVAVTSIAGHFCIDAFKAVSRLPVLDLLDSLAAHVADKGFRKVGVLGTRPVMESAVYGRLPGVAVLAPSKLDAVHQAYVDMAMSGQATEARRAVFFEAGRALCPIRTPRPSSSAAPISSWPSTDRNPASPSSTRPGRISTKSRRRRLADHCAGK